MVKDISSIQFIGTQRSGSNLLRVMLNQLPEISAPHPPHILKVFSPLLPLYGDLGNPKNFHTLVADICEWVNHNPVPWENVELDAAEIVTLCDTPTLVEVMHRIYEKKALLDGAKFWCCKSMESVYHVNDLESSGLKPFYIYIYRDGRDVALSFKSAIVGPKHIYHLARKWKQEQELSLEVIKSLPKDRCVVVRYENFITHPKEVLMEICSKLKVDYSDSVFDYFKSHESINAASSGNMWRNLVRPILDHNVDKYKSGLTDDEIVLFEKVAGSVLSELGYTTAHWPHVTDEPFSDEEIEKFDKQNETLKREVIQKANPVELEKRAAQDKILERIKARKKVAI